MLGVLYTAASDFSSFSHPRAHECFDLCIEEHDTAIEKRYCPKRHIDVADDREWDALVQRHVRDIDQLSMDSTTIHGKRYSLTVNTTLDSLAFPDDCDEQDSPSTAGSGSDTFSSPLEAPPSTPISAYPTSPPSLIDGDDEDLLRDEESDQEQESESDFDLEKVRNTRLTLTVMAASNRKRTKKHGKSPQPVRPVKRLKRSDSFSSISSDTSITSMSSNVSSSTAAFLQSMAGSENPWKCPHCPWVQHTQRLPDFLRHQRSHFVSQSDWPCPNSKCGKGFARKDSLKRHLDNKATGCKRPPGYMVC